MSSAYILFLLIYLGFISRKPTYFNRKFNNINCLSYYVIIASVVLASLSSDWVSILDNKVDIYI